MSDKSDKVKDTFNPLSAVLRKHAAVVVSEPGEHGALSATDALAWRSWFDRRRRGLSSSGGRPTNPKWTLRRQIPFSPETWEELEARARACSAGRQKIAPGQLAAFILEDSVGHRPGGGARFERCAEQGGEVSDDLGAQGPESEDWNMPELFSGCVA